jgi:hypothetical protein
MRELYLYNYMDTDIDRCMMKELYIYNYMDIDGKIKELIIY